MLHKFDKAQKKGIRLQGGSARLRRQARGANEAEALLGDDMNRNPAHQPGMDAFIAKRTQESAGQQAREYRRRNAACQIHAAAREHGERMVAGGCAVAGGKYVHGIQGE